MIDKLSCFSRNFTVKNNADIKLYPSPISYGTGEVEEYVLFRNEFGESVKGSKAICNIEGLFSATISMFGLNVAYNPTVVMSPDNHNRHLITERQLQESLSLVENGLRSKGIIADLKQFKMVRIDIAKDVELSHSFSQYGQVFELTTPTRMMTKTTGDTYTFLNGQRQYCFYDKLQQQIDTNVIPESALNGVVGSVVRGEIRYLNSNEIEHKMGISKISHLLDYSFSDLKHLYVGELETAIFPKKVCEHFQDLEEIRWVFQKAFNESQQGKRNTILNALSSLGIEYLLSKMSLSELRSIMSDIGFHRNTVRFELKRIEDMIYEKKIQSSDNPLTIKNLYQELRTKFLSVA